MPVVSRTSLSKLLGAKVATLPGGKVGLPTASQFVSQHRGRFPLCVAENAVLGVIAGGGCHDPQWGPFRGVTPGKF